jgi:3-hydroxyacyl-CoA dehydrogenase / enoyl-CoA hydratase / 3-hydroxybutyryl-CoA epimerase
MHEEATSLADREPGLRVSRQDWEAVAVLTLDTPGRSMNVVDAELLGQLRGHVHALAGDQSITGVVLCSAKPSSFGAGADLVWLNSLLTQPGAERFLRELHELMYRVVAAPQPWVTAINGAALGGALELALATEAIVVTPSARLGLPESSLGLIPGGAGTQLISRWLPTSSALDLMITGRPLDAAAAVAAGLAQAITEPASLIDSAIGVAASLAGSSHRRPHRQDTDEAARVAVEERRAGEVVLPGSAGERILEAVAAGIEQGPQAGCAAERREFLLALSSAESAALRHLFLSESTSKRGGSATTGIERLGVVGAGLMGSGLAATAVMHGLSAVVRDLTDDKLASANAYLVRALQRTVIDPASVADRWAATTEWAGFAESDAIIEAVFELPELKQRTLAEVSSIVSADTLIATNTSAIPIHTLAGSVTHPERFLGTHFFSPVERMALVELIVHDGTTESTLRRARALARKMGKIPITVADRPGFFTSRVYARWLIEGLRLLNEGVSIADIESAARAVGFPVGPLQAHDEVSLDLVIKASIDQVASKVMDDRLEVGSVRAMLNKLIAAGIEGRRTGRGFYRYKDGRRSGPNLDVATTLGLPISPLPIIEVGQRLVLAFASEAFLCWDDGTLRHPDDGDVASVVGIGFPRRLGGPFHWADQVGATTVIAQSEAFGAATFPVGRSIAGHARSGGRFADVPRDRSDAQ